jgi:integrase/recombinase XerC
VRGREGRAGLPAPLSLAAGRQHTVETILRAWYQGKSAHTIAAYRHDLEDFALYLSLALRISPRLSVNDAMAKLFRQSSPSAHEIVLGFREWMMGGQLSPASINRHLATLRSMSKLARMLGAVGDWRLEVPGVKAEPRRDTSGPSVADVRAMLDATRGDTEAETRDHAILLTLYALGLRVAELCGLTLQETDLDRGTAWVKGKGRREKALIPLPASVVAAIRRYLVYRGPTDGPLFQSRGLRGKARDGRLDTRSVLRIVRTRGQQVGLHVWCHGLRHTGITAAVEHGQKAGVGLDQIRVFSRHRTLATMLLYRDEHDRVTTHRTLVDIVAAQVAS